MKLFHILNEWSNLFIHEKTGGSISRYKCYKNIYLENYFHYQIWYQVKSKLLRMRTYDLYTDRKSFPKHDRKYNFYFPSYLRTNDATEPGII